MEQLPNGITMELSPGAFPLSTDSMVLSHFVRLPRRARVLDLGSGCGTLGLLLCTRDCSCTVTGIELDPAAHQMALENIRTNQLSHRLSSIQADLRKAPVTPGSFDVCVSNPPYFSGGAASTTLPHARQEQTCTLEQVIHAASQALKFGGDFFLVHKADRLGEIITHAAAHNLEAKRLCLLRHRPGAPVNLILLQLRKGAKPGLSWEEIHLHETDGSPTDIYKQIYHL